PLEDARHDELSAPRGHRGPLELGAVELDGVRDRRGPVRVEEVDESEDVLHVHDAVVVEVVSAKMIRRVAEDLRRLDVLDAGTREGHDRLREDEGLREAAPRQELSPQIDRGLVDGRVEDDGAGVADVEEGGALRRLPRRAVEEVE